MLLIAGKVMFKTGSYEPVHLSVEDISAYISSQCIIVASLSRPNT